MIGCEGRSHKMFSCVGLRKMDFLNVPGRGCDGRTQSSSARHPGSLRTFRNIRVPKLLGIDGTLRKSHLPAQDTREHFVRSACGKLSKELGVRRASKLA